MAGSLAHITATDGSFTMELIDNMGDAEEALEDCHAIIAFLLPFAARAMDNSDATGALREAAHQLKLYVGENTPVFYK